MEAWTDSFEEVHGLHLLGLFLEAWMRTICTAEEPSVVCHLLAEAGSSILFHSLQAEHLR